MIWLIIVIFLIINLRSGNFIILFITTDKDGRCLAEPDCQLCAC